MGEALVVDPRKAVQCLRREASARVKELLLGGGSVVPCASVIAMCRRSGSWEYCRLYLVGRKLAPAIVVVLAEG